MKTIKEIKVQMVTSRDEMGTSKKMNGWVRPGSRLGSGFTSVNLNTIFSEIWRPMERLTSVEKGLQWR